MNRLIEHRYLAIFILMILLTVPFMGRGLFESSEGRYARISQTMVHTDNFSMPTLNGKNHLTKPPLTYWLIATGINIAGENTFGARLFHTIAWIITALIIVRIGTELESPRTGMFAGLVFATSLLPSIGSWSLTTDPLLVFFQAFYLLALIRYEKERDIESALIFWVMLGFALFTKGPVALLPLLFFLLRWRETIRQLIKTNLWMIGLIIGAGWYLALEYQYHGILLRLIKDELILRSTTDISGRNPFWWAPFIIYGIPVLVGWGLWPFLVRRKSIVQTLKLSKNHWQKLMLIWVLGTLVFFSFVQSRLPLYILPLTIPMSLLLGHLIQGSQHTLKIAATNCILILSLKSYGTFMHESPDNSLQLSTFAKTYVKNDPVNLFWEKSLFGFEFYLPYQVQKYINPYSDFNPQTYPVWVLYQKKRDKIFEQFLQEKNLKINQTHTFFKWKLTEVQLQKNILTRSNKTK